MTTKITKLKLDNVGGFKDFEIDFHDKLTVLIGNNGSGKTTILSSIAFLFNTILDGVTSKKFSSIQSIDNVFNKNINASIKADLFFNKKTYSCSLLHNEYNSISSNFGHLQENIISHIINLSIKNYLPLFLYYPTHKAPIGNINFFDIELETQLFATYIAACSNEVFDANRFFNWFRWQENIKKEVGDNKKYEIVRQAIYQVLNDKNNTFDNLRITWLKNPNGDLYIDKNGTPLNINQLSAGEKMLLILVADLARRLIVANPKSDNPLHGDGVILIDEIDLHLHPSWQRKIVPNLTKIFKNCQFIISTHSDLILSEVEPENIIKLENFKALYNTQHTKGRDANSIRSDIMGVSERSPDIQEKLQECFTLIDNEKILEAEQKLEILEKQLGPNDPDVVYIHSLISFHKE